MHHVGARHNASAGIMCKTSSKSETDCCVHFLFDTALLLQHLPDFAALFSTDNDAARQLSMLQEWSLINACG